MNVQVTIGDKTIEIPHTIFSHAVTCHSLHLHEWAKKERDTFAKRINEGIIDREEAERQLGWLYDNLDKIGEHRKANDLMKETLDEVLQRQNTTAFLAQSRP